MNFYEYLLLTVAGVIAGFINVVAGGGSLITLPLMIFFGLPSGVANGTNRLGLLAQNISSVLNFRKHGLQVSRHDIFLGVSALLGACLGAYLALDISENAFHKILSIVMVLVAITLLIDKKPKTKSIEDLKPWQKVLGITVFFLIGIYGGFLHAGIGFIIILSLSKLYGYDLVKTNSIKVTIAFIYTWAAFGIFAWEGAIDWKAGLFLVPGTAFGGWLGSLFSVKKGDKWIKRIVMAAIIVMAVKLWFFN